MNELAENAQRSATDYIAMSEAYKTVTENLLTQVMGLKVGILRDYSTTGIALLGGVLTLLTVKPDLVKTPIAMIIGATLTVCAILASFYIRHRITEFITESLGYQGKIYTAGLSASLALYRAPLDQVAGRDFQDILNRRADSPKVGRMIEKGDVAVGIGLLIGVALVAISVLLYVRV